MATLFSDNFNRANEELNASANWTEPASDSDVLSNRLRITTAAPSPWALNGRTTTTAHAAVADMKVSLTIVSTGRDGGPAARCTATNTAYWVETYTGTWELWRMSAGTGTNLGSRAVTTVAGDIVTISVQGSTIQLLKNGVVQGANFTDTNITAAGQAGVADWAGAMDYDDFLVEDFASGFDAATLPHILTNRPVFAPAQAVGY